MNIIRNIHFDNDCVELYFKCVCVFFLKPLIPLLFTVSYMLVTPQGGSLHYCVFKHSEWAKKVMNGIFSFLDNLLMALRAGHSRLDCNDRHAPVDRSIHPHQHRLHCEDPTEQNHEPLPHSSRSERVWAPGRDLAGWDSNSLLNLGWNSGMHRKSNLAGRDTKQGDWNQRDASSRHSGEGLFLFLPLKNHWRTPVRLFATTWGPASRNKPTAQVVRHRWELCTCWWFTGG